MISALSTASPVVRHDLKKLDRSEDLIVWFGHSGYLLQMDGVRYLIDPVFVEGAPFGISNAFFKGTQVFDVADLPEIDYLVISHDHWDHLDYHVAKELQSRVRKVYTGLGVGAHLERWGYRPDQIVELDWGEAPDGRGWARTLPPHAALLRPRSHACPVAMGLLRPAGPEALGLRRW